MGYTKRQTWQIVNQEPLEVLETSSREQLDNLNKILDNKLDYPFRVSIDSLNNLIKISGSELQTLKSDGLGGTTPSFKISASSTAGQYSPIPESILNLSDGTFTGSFASSTTLSCPNINPGDYIWMGVELKIDGKYHVIFGNPDSVNTSATYPLFSGEAVILVQLQRDNSGIAPWFFLKPNTSDFTHFKNASIPKISEDGVTKVRIIDLVSTVLPSGSVLLDTKSIAADDIVLFTQAPIEGIYRAVGAGNNIISWDKLFAPANGANVQVTDGTAYLTTIWKKVRSTWIPIEISDAVKDPSGFPNRVDSAISFVDATRSFTIQPSLASSIPGAFDYFVKGLIYRCNTAKTEIIPNIIGLHYVYFDGDLLKTVTAQTSAYYETLITEGAVVAQIYWDGTQAAIVGDERHGITMDGATHKYLHFSNGAVLQSGLSLGGFTTSGTGSVDADSQITLSQGRMFDEDIDFIIGDTTDSDPNIIHKQILNSASAKIPMFHRTGSLGTWAKIAATDFPVMSGTSRIQWNYYDGSIWSLVDASLDDTYVTSWVFATNSIIDPVIAIIGQKEFTSLSDAQQDETYASLLLGDFPSTEFKLLYRLIFKTSSTYTNTPKAKLEHVQDLRIAPDSPFTSVSLHDHGLLSGLNDPDHAPTAVTTTGVSLDGGFSASDYDLKKALNTLNDLFGQLRLKQLTSDRVSITGATRTLNNGTKMGQAIGLLLLEFEGAQIDFSTGEIFAADGTTPLGIDFIPSVITSGDYFWYSVSVVANQVSASNALTAQIIVVPSASSGPSPVLAPFAPFAPGIKIGQVVVQSSGATPGAINSITSSNIIQLGVGSGGGGGDGTGDASELLERLKIRFDQSNYEYFTPNIYSITGTSETSPSSSASYSVVNSSYAFPSVGSTYLSINSLDPYYLNNVTADVDRVELIAFYNKDYMDTAPMFQLSRDGGSNWQNAVVPRIGLSDTYRGTHIFSNEATDSFSTAIGSTSVGQYDFTDSNNPSRLFNLVDATTIRTISANISVVGNPIGTLKAKIVKDIAGLPSSNPNDVIASSTVLSLVAITSGIKNFTITAPLSPGNYHVVFETDVDYRSSYTINFNNRISIDRDFSGLDKIIYSISGRLLNLLVRIVSGTSGAVLRGYGVFYKQISSGTTEEDNLSQHTINFNGITQNFSTFTLPFIPKPKFIKVYEVNTGQVYVPGSFTISNNDIIFPVNTFSKPETISLLFEQYVVS